MRTIATAATAISASDGSSPEDSTTSPVEVPENVPTDASRSLSSATSSSAAAL